MKTSRQKLVAMSQNLKQEYCDFLFSKLGPAEVDKENVDIVLTIEGHQFRASAFLPELREMAQAVNLDPSTIKKQLRSYAASILIPFHHPTAMVPPKTPTLIELIKNRLKEMQSREKNSI